MIMGSVFDDALLDYIINAIFRRISSPISVLLTLFMNLVFFILVGTIA